MDEYHINNIYILYIYIIYNSIFVIGHHEVNSNDEIFKTRVTYLHALYINYYPYIISPSKRRHV